MYCKNCGKEMAENAKFCSYCGSENNATNRNFVDVTVADEVVKEQKPVKKSKRKIIGIVLLCLQVFSILGIVANGEISNLTGYFTSGISGIFEMLSFFLPAIIGVILLVLDYMKKNK
ncbi:MAG: zinc-ribbon domain-containing protein [Clostridia bacterium]|nr:zinc-ribbon domain-containing protein [Clostridia bacterium]